MMDITAIPIYPNLSMTWTDKFFTAQDATSAIIEGKDLDEITDAAIAGAGRGLVDVTVDGAVHLGNKGASALGATPLTEAGETLTSDVIKSAVPKVEVPKKKDE